MLRRVIFRSLFYFLLPLPSSKHAWVGIATREDESGAPPRSTSIASSIMAPLLSIETFERVASGPLVLHMLQDALTNSTAPSKERTSSVEYPKTNMR